MTVVLLQTAFADKWTVYCVDKHISLGFFSIFIYSV